jgi:hypothetical protein
VGRIKRDTKLENQSGHKREEASAKVGRALTGLASLTMSNLKL